MRLGRRDWIATVFVVVGVVVYLVWLFDLALPGLSSGRAVTLAVLATGVAASASAVVPSFVQLLHGSKLYLVATLVIGAVALVAGIIAILNRSEIMLGVLVVATAMLWIIATVRHTKMSAGSRLASAGR